MGDIASSTGEFLKRTPREIAIQLTLLAIDRVLDVKYASRSCPLIMHAPMCIDSNHVYTVNRSPREFISKAPGRHTNQIHLSDQMRYSAWVV